METLMSKPSLRKQKKQRQRAKAVRYRKPHGCVVLYPKLILAPNDVPMGFVQLVAGALKEIHLGDQSIFSQACQMFYAVMRKVGFARAERMLAPWDGGVTRRAAHIVWRPD